MDESLQYRDWSELSLKILMMLNYIGDAASRYEFLRDFNCEKSFEVFTKLFSRQK